MKNELILLTGADIPFLEAQVNIHQPTIKEISIISEENFLMGIRFLNFSKELIDDVDKKDLENIKDFDIFMSIMNSREKIKNDALMVLTLIFPSYEIKVQEKEIVLIDKEHNSMGRLNSFNYDIFKDIVVEMFCLNDEKSDAEEYNPENGLAKKIADKLKKRQEILNKRKGKSVKDEDRIYVYGKYVSILAIGLGLDVNTIVDYTVYQLMDQMNRFGLKTSYDIYIQAKMAGASDLDEVDNWMDDIHS